MFGEASVIYVDIWNHPIETSFMSFMNGCFRFQDKISIHFTLLSNDPSSIPVQRWQARRKRKRDADDAFPPSPSTPDGAGGADDLTNSLPRKRPRCCCRGRERCAQKVGKFFSGVFPVAETTKLPPFFLFFVGDMAMKKSGWDSCPVGSYVGMTKIAPEWFFSMSETNRTSLGCSWALARISILRFDCK